MLDSTDYKNKAYKYCKYISINYKILNRMLRRMDCCNNNLFKFLKPIKHNNYQRSHDFSSMEIEA